MYTHTFSGALFNLTQTAYIKMDVYKHLKEISPVDIDKPIHRVSVMNIRAITSAMFSYIEEQFYANAMEVKMVAMMSGELYSQAIEAIFGVPTS